MEGLVITWGGVEQVPSRAQSFARCARCSLLRLCLTVAGVPLCRFCREHEEDEG